MTSVFLLVCLLSTISVTTSLSATGASQPDNNSTQLTPVAPANGGVDVLGGESVSPGVIRVDIDSFITFNDNDAINYTLSWANDTPFPPSVLLQGTSVQIFFNTTGEFHYTLTPIVNKKRSIEDHLKTKSAKKLKGKVQSDNNNLSGTIIVTNSTSNSSGPVPPVPIAAPIPSTNSTTNSSSEVPLTPLKGKSMKFKALANLHNAPQQIGEPVFEVDESPRLRWLFPAVAVLFLAVALLVIGLLYLRQHFVSGERQPLLMGDAPSF